LVNGIRQQDTKGRFYREPDNTYVTEVPELPGCMADGVTTKEALENTEKVIAEWIETAKVEGRPVPEPKGRLKFA
jgi:predicted RNase H-like HicB family nuclease